ncbi:MAG: hypothetical protein GX144_01630 [Clostridiaceae bacterium]|nr:hypothetical protein [Clostridiaceae bacterium]
MEECAEVAMMLDFYGQLLTHRQYEILDLYYNSDFSLGEIAGQLNISRQGVYDSVKKGKEALKRFEEKLGLVKRFSIHGEALHEVLVNLQQIQPKQKESQESKIIQDSIDRLKKAIDDL